MDSNLRRWYFQAEGHDGEQFCIDQNGVQLDYTDARDVPFIGTSREADTEASRRSDLWEEKYNGLIAKVTYCSLGKLKEAHGSAEGEK